MPDLSLADPVVQKIIFTVVSLTLIWVAVLVVAKLVAKAIHDKLWRHKTRKFAFYLGFASSLIALIVIWFVEGGQFAITLSVIGAGLALALQQPLVSMAGWAYIVSNHPYDVGDRIEINGVSGDVVDIRLFKTVLFESFLEGTASGTQTTGRVIDFPNSYVLTHNTINYTRGFEYMWNEYPILVTFESNWNKAYELLAQILIDETERFEAPAKQQVTALERRYLIYDEKMNSSVYIAIQDSGVELGLRYLAPARQRRMIRDTISRRILSAFELEADIELAYPTYRYFRREIEEAKIAMREQFDDAADVTSEKES